MGRLCGLSFGQIGVLATLARLGSSCVFRRERTSRRGIAMRGALNFVYQLHHFRKVDNLSLLLTLHISASELTSFELRPTGVLRRHALLWLLAQLVSTPSFFLLME